MRSDKLVKLICKLGPDGFFIICWLVSLCFILLFLYYRNYKWADGFFAYAIDFFSAMMASLVGIGLGIDVAYIMSDAFAHFYDNDFSSAKLLIEPSLVFSFKYVIGIWLSCIAFVVAKAVVFKKDN